MCRQKISTFIFVIACLLLFLSVNVLGNINSSKDNIPLFHSHPNISLVSLSNHNPLIPNQSISNRDGTSSIVVDELGNLVVGGYTDESGYLARLSTNGTLIQSSLNSKVVSYSDVVFDSNKNLIFGADVFKSDIPLVGNSAQANFGGVSDIFIEKQDQNGNTLWNTYWGGSEDERISNLVIDSQDNIFVIGSTQSNDIVTTPNAFDNSPGFGFDTLIVKFSPNGTVIFSSYFGGSAYEEVGNIELDKSDNLIIVGQTESTDFELINPEDSSFNGIRDVYVVKISASNELVFSTFLGGSGIDLANGVAVDDVGNIFVVGKTFSHDFPLEKPSRGTLVGGNDGFITEYSQSGELIWSTYYGGSRDDEITAVEFIESDVFVITGTTKSEDFEKTDNSLDASTIIVTNIFVNKITIDGELIWGSIIGGNSIDDVSDLTLDKDGNIIFTGNTNSDDFPTKNSYPFTFGDQDSIVGKINQLGEIIWLTRTAVIIYPNLDSDEDGLLNFEEYSNGTNPLSSDTDGDSMDDKWEIDYKLDPNVDDSDKDPDQDKLLNYFEAIGDTSSDPHDPDTDDDGMPDGWEFTNLLNRRADDHNSDRIDNDGMPALWEYLMRLSPLIDDAEDDKDKDGVSNLNEWEYTIANVENWYENSTYVGLNATNPDTDGDGMKDGWEVKYRLDPLKKDANEDPDNDFLDNGFEHKYGLDPRNRRELYVMIVILLMSISGLIYILIKIRSINNQAKKQNFTSIWDKRQSLKAGFETQEERQETIARGFLTKEIRDIVLATGLENVDKIKESWEQRNLVISNEIEDYDLDGAIINIQQVQSVRELQITDSRVQKLLVRYQDYNVKLNNQIALQDTLLNLINKTRSSLIVGISKSYIEITRNASNEISHRLHNIIKPIQGEMENRKEWFQPWEALLTLIQITPDNKPINISEIMQVINKSEDHAEELLMALLQDNSKIGSYDPETKNYTKAVNINIYLETALAQIKDTSEDQED